MDFDNVLYDNLPDALFTDPFHKSVDTLNVIAVLSSGIDIGAGNSVTVPAGYFSQVLPGSPGGPASLAPTTPQPGLSPGCETCAEVPEPSSLVLFATALCGACIRRRVVRKSEGIP